MTLESTAEKKRRGREPDTAPADAAAKVRGVTPTAEEVGDRSDRSRPALAAG